jgi:hypothetical protein
MPRSPRTSAGCTPVISRRQMLQVGGTTAKADACVLIFLNGGPSHLDMWDMKPDAPDGIRGEFKPVATTVPGIQFSEHMPRLCRQAHLATIVRSMHHSVNNAHAAAVYTSLTGHDRGDNIGSIGGGPNEYPAMGSVLGSLRPPDRPIVPHVCLPYITKEGAGGPPQSGFFGGMLGRAYDPLFVLKDPNAPEFAVPELTLTADVSLERLSARQHLFETIDRQFDSGPGRSAYDGMDGFRRRALGLLTSVQTQNALRTGDKPDATRDRYGRNIYGQSVLLARRLIEAGTRMVTISWAPDANATWDTHGNNFTSLKNTLLPQFDAACSSLVDDLRDRGMLERTLVAVLGDFGRTPKINGNGGGRDHWNYCYSLMLIGGGFKGGFIYGASDKIGAFPARDALVPGDIISTIYHALGIDPAYELHDQLARPHRLVPAGRVVPELLA